MCWVDDVMIDESNDFQGFLQFNSIDINGLTNTKLFDAKTWVYLPRYLNIPNNVRWKQNK